MTILSAIESRFWSVSSGEFSKWSYRYFSSVTNLNQCLMLCRHDDQRHCGYAAIYYDKCYLGDMGYTGTPVLSTPNTRTVYFNDGL